MRMTAFGRKTTTQEPKYFDNRQPYDTFQMRRRDERSEPEEPVVDVQQDEDAERCVLRVVC